MSLNVDGLQFEQNWLTEQDCSSAPLGLYSLICSSSWNQTKLKPARENRRPQNAPLRMSVVSEIGELESTLPRSEINVCIAMRSDSAIFVDINEACSVLRFWLMNGLSAPSPSSLGLIRIAGTDSLRSSADSCKASTTVMHCTSVLQREG